MSTAPIVPRRPTRSPTQADLSNSALDTPQVPPHPQRPIERHVSEDREAYARSPLNASPFPHADAVQLLQMQAQQGDELERSPSVASLPLIGQEGIEYASLDQPLDNLLQQKDLNSQHKHPRETRNVADDLPLHAPKASASPMTQKSRVAAVTRTDTEKAAVAGIGKPKTEYNGPDRSGPGVQYRPPSAVSTECPGSAQQLSLSELEQEQEQGIPSIGDTVPLYPNAGDVQAPTPGPGSAGLPLGELSRPGTTEGQKRSAHGFHGPPGSYGLHGHGVAPHDKFEKAWYDKHPEELAKEEEGAHHPAAHDERPPWALSSAELNKLVHATGKVINMGTLPGAIGTPTEAVGYQASEEYASRSHSPQTTPPHSAKPRFSRPSSQSYVESPLKQTIFPAERRRDNVAAEDELSDGTVHVVPPTRPQGGYSSAENDPSSENLGLESGNSDEKAGWIDERGEGTPILASDEIQKHPTVEWMQPAISPSQQMTEDEYFSAAETEHPPYRSSHSRSRSKGHSRPSSLHSHSGLSRYSTHDEGTNTPLEEIEEYEPLFKDDDALEAKKSKVFAERLKRPDLRQQHFPSKDIWEDTPNSSQLETTVETPEGALPTSSAMDASSVVFEHPEKEQLRKAEFIEQERQANLTAPSQAGFKPKFNPSVQGEIPSRPGMRQRFPSRDIWEDTPDSLRLETTIGDQAVNVDTKPSGSIPSKPLVPARPSRTRHEPHQDTQEVPTRPPPREPPFGLDRSKPAVPQRPSRSLNKEHLDTSQLTKTDGDQSAQMSASNTGISGSTPKAKPAAPARPTASSKFASIKAGFMSDLNSRLSKGPLPPPKPQQEVKETEEEKAPLSDARKGRARGPARRKPAASPTPTIDTSTASAGVGRLGISSAWSVWSIDPRGTGLANVETGILSTPSVKPQRTARELDEQPKISPLATNTAGEPLLQRSDAPQTNTGVLAHQKSLEMDARARRELEIAEGTLHDIQSEQIGHQGDVPEPIIDHRLALTTFAAADDTRADSSNSSEAVQAKDAKVEHPDVIALASEGQDSYSLGTTQAVSRGPLAPETPNDTQADIHKISRPEA